MRKSIEGWFKREAKVPGANSNVGNAQRNDVWARDSDLHFRIQEQKDKVLFMK
jgi:hypothetical protein